MQVRRFVTAPSEGGRSTVEDVPVPVDRGTGLVELWRVVGPMRDAGAGFAPTESQGIVQDAGGFAWRIFVLGPGERPLHRTPTLDLLEVLDGSIVVLLDTGEVTLRAGDCLILRGDVHGWRNDAATPAILAAAMFGADDAAGERSEVSSGGGRSGPRRVVTGIDEHGRSRITTDGVPPHAWDDNDEVRVAELWQTMAPLVHDAQGGDEENGSSQWQPAGAGVAWRHVSVASGGAVSLHGKRLDLILVRSGVLAVDDGSGDVEPARPLSAIVRRGADVELRNEGREPAELSVLSVCQHAADGNDG